MIQQIHINNFKSLKNISFCCANADNQPQPQGNSAFYSRIQKLEKTYLKAEEKNYIVKIYPDGKIHIRLHRTQRGLGLCVQTTGKNYPENHEIAKLLEKEY